MLVIYDNNNDDDNDNDKDDDNVNDKRKLTMIPDFKGED